MTNIKEIIVTPKRGEYDVIVVGGGIGGICAAVSAKRSGADKVLLIEKGIQLGGLATSGLISWYEPLCDGQGNKIMYGLADELMKIAIRYGPDCLPEEWSDFPDNIKSEARCSTHFSHSIFSLGLDQLLISSGTDILLDTQAVKPIMRKNECKGIVVENKTGRSFYKTKIVIDATGDADILFRAGVPCSNGKNYLTYIAYYADCQTAKKTVDTKNTLNMRKWMTVGSNLWGDGHPNGAPMPSGITAKEVTKFVLEGRSLLLEKIRNENRFTRDISALPNMAQFRKTRRINGDYTLMEDDEGKFFFDSVAIVGDFANKGKIYEIPYRSLYNSQYSNLLTVGRSISSSGWAWDVTRVIPAAAATGQAAGIAAAICVGKNKAVGEISVIDIQKLLIDTGVKLHIKYLKMGDEK